MDAQIHSGNPGHDGSLRRFTRGVLATILAGLLAAGSVPAFAADEPAAADETNAAAAAKPNIVAPVTGDALPTAQIDGVAYGQAIAKDTVYAGGEFKNARPAGAAPGTNESPRANVLAYNLTTGELDKSWNPGTNGNVKAITTSPSKDRVYIAGYFTQAGGKERLRVAAFDTYSGALVESFAPQVNGRIEGLVATETTVYLAGEFTSVNNVQRAKVAAVRASDGSLLPFKADVAGGDGARAVVVSPDEKKIVISGNFASVNGSTNPGRGIAALNATTGELMPWKMNDTLRNGPSGAWMYSLASDGDSVYGTGADFGGSKTEDGFEGAFRARWSDGALVWMQDCHGDTYSVAPMGGSVFVAGHPHACTNIGGFPDTDPRSYYHSLSFSKEPSGPIISPDRDGYRSFAGQQAPTLQHWFPVWTVGSYTGIWQAVWNVAADDNYVVYGGEFPKVNSINQQGLTRFARPDLAPKKAGPQVQGGAWALNGTSVRRGENRLAWTANTDVDDRTLTYEVRRRDKGSTPLWTGKKDSTFWIKPQMNFADKTAVPGQTYDYQIRVSDPRGNSTVSAWRTVKTATQTVSKYANQVLDDDPVNYWRLSDTSTSTSVDSVGTENLTMTGGFTRSAQGAFESDDDTATTFGGRNGFGATSTAQPGPNSYALETWFKTTSTNGGKILGFGNRKTGNSTSFDRHIFLDGQGRVNYGVHDGSQRTISSQAGLNDGEWHHVVANLSPDGMELFLDGRRIGRLADVTAGQQYSGFWRVGGDSSWAGANYFAGTIDDVAIYRAPLTAEQVNNHWVASGRESTIPVAPKDTYGARVFSDEPSAYWRLGETSGRTAADSGPAGNPGVYSTSGVTYGRPGAIDKTQNTAIALDGQNGQVASARAWDNPRTYSLETWFKTSTRRGGKLIGFDGNQFGGSGQHDRHVYMQDSGRLVFGTYTGRQNLITTDTAFNDGAWHHVVATQGSDGMKLYVDGKLVGTNSATGAEQYTGYWRVGGGATWGSTSNYFAGQLDEVAIYPTVVSAQTVTAHYQLGTGTTPNEPPTAAFTTSAEDLVLSVDGTSSSDPDGSIASWDWDYGDGTTGTGKTASRTYAKAGTYTVTLIVTDDRGAKNSTSKDVTVLAKNQLPTASFTSSARDLAVTFDGTGSTDADGTIAAWAWDFGDGATGQGSTAAHTYQEAGTYPVSLTVTDDRGGKNTVKKNITVQAPPAQLIARDLFDRTQTNGWGVATTGGRWSAEGGPAAFSVTDGAGKVALKKFDTRTARLTSVTTDSVDIRAEMAVDRTGPGFNWTLLGRQNDAGRYSARLRYEANGAVRLSLLRDEVSIGNTYVLPGAYESGERLTVRFKVTGTSPTTLSAKVWRSSDPEPTQWNLTGTDSTEGLQQPGTIGLTQYLGGSSPTDTANSSLLSFVATR